MRFSIITVSYNAEDTIKETIDSVLCQNFTDFEIVIQDGMSLDDTLKKVARDPRIKIVSEKDKGIYDAMNKAISRAKGEYLIFLNCGDVLSDNSVLDKIDKYIQSVDENKSHIFYGDFYVDNALCNQTKELSNFYLYRRPLCHQTMIIKNDLFVENGLYDVKYKILADYDFTLRCWKKNTLFKHVGFEICKYLGGGVSENEMGMKQKEIERKEIVKKYYLLRQRVLYDILLLVSMRKLRIKIMSGSSPVFVKKIYRLLANKINSK